MAAVQEKAADPAAASITLPEKAAFATTTEGISSANLTPVHTTTTPEKSLDLHRDSNLSTPRSYRNENPFDTDIEAMITTTSSSDPYAMKTITTTKADCPTIWPGKQDWKARAKAAKRDRNSCACLARMSKRNKIMMKIAIGLLIIGIGVGVGFGVSKPLGAPIWGDPDQNK